MSDSKPPRFQARVPGPQIAGSPAVDIVMPAKDAEDTIVQAVESLLSQTYSDFRLLVVDDHSTDSTPDLLRALAESDSRIVLMTNDGDGIVSALNCGLGASTAPYVARMDADDLSLPDRLMRQIEHLDSHPDLVLLGTRIRWIGDRTGEPPMVVGAEACRRALGLFTPFCHPSVVMRRSALEKLAYLYDPELEFAEDYDLFSRLALVGSVDNLDEVLLLYRTHTGQISNRMQHDQNLRSLEITRRYVTALDGGRVPGRLALAGRMVGCVPRLGIRNIQQGARSAFRKTGLLLKSRARLPGKAAGLPPAREGMDGGPATPLNKRDLFMPVFVGLGATLTLVWSGFLAWMLIAAITG